MVTWKEEFLLVHLLTRLVILSEKNKYLGGELRTAAKETYLLACVTEQTHVIRVYGLCDGARFAVPHNFA